MAFRNYILLRKNNSSTKRTSFMKPHRSADGEYKFYCINGRYINSFIKVIPTPSDANVTLVTNGHEQINNSIYSSIGEEVSVLVSKDGYKTYRSTFNAEETDYFLKVNLLEAANIATLTINPTPSDAKVTLIAEGYEQFGNSIEVNKGTSVTYIVEKEGYATQTSTIMVDTNTDINVKLVDFVTITINPLPNGATVKLTYLDKILPKEWGVLQSFGVSAVPADDVRGSYARKCFCFVTDKGAFSVVTDMNNDIVSREEILNASFYEGEYTSEYNSAWYYGNNDWEPAIAEDASDRINYYVGGKVVRNIRHSTLDMWGWRDGYNSCVIDGYTYTLDDNGVMIVYYNDKEVLKLK